MIHYQIDQKFGVKVEGKIMFLLLASGLIGAGRGVLSLVPVLVVSLFLYVIWKNAELF